MTEYVPVEPGVNLSQAIGDSRLTKAKVRELMRDHPEWDWRNLGLGGAYVNGEDCILNDLVLQVYDRKRPGTTVAMVNFQAVEKVAGSTKPCEVWGYQAVVS